MTHPSLNTESDALDDQGVDIAQPIPNEALQQVQEVLESLRPGVQRDGGDLELVAIQGNIVRVRLSGACVGCSLAAQTLGGVRRALVKALGNPGIRVLPAV